MGKIVSGVTDAVGLTDSKAGDRSNQASIAAAQIAAEGQKESLDYLKQVEELPLEIRNQFLPQLADIYSGGAGQDKLISSAMNSPLYQQLIGNQAQGEEAILKNASATGGLRSGNTNRALHEYNVRSTNEALTQAYGQQLQGIQGLAGIPLNTNAVANATAAPSATTAQGIVAGAQAQQQQSQANMNNLSTVLGGGMMAYALSDIRLKKNIKPKGNKNGHEMWSWDWNKLAEKLYGLKGKAEGVMSHLVYEYMPEAIAVNEDGYIMVDYSMLEVH